MKTVSIIGSFRKPNHYAKIVEIINMLRQKGIKVLSPEGTSVVDSVDNFVVFSSDNPNLTPAQIEEETIKKSLILILFMFVILMVMLEKNTA